MDSYPQLDRNTIRRKKERAVYDFATVHSIVNSTTILNVSFVPANPSVDPFPTTLPMLGQMGCFAQPNTNPAGESLDLYLHGHSSSRLMKLPSSSEASEAGVLQAEGLPVSIAATKLDGLILAFTPFAHSCNFRSAVLHGYATPVTDEAEKNYALSLITDSIVPKRWENTRTPPTKAELTSTGVLKVSIVSASAKIHVGGPGDGKKDLNDEEVVGKVWAGVIPVWESMGAPIPAEYNQVERVPEYISGWREQQNRQGEQYAGEVSVTKKTK